MKKKNIKNKIKGKGEINMSLYEINQSLISQLPAYDENKIEDLKTRINNWESKYFEENFYMLLCREINYYTVFQHRKPIRAEFDTLGNAVISILLDTDWTIHSDEIEENSDHCEIWAKNKTTGQEAHAFMLFPYSEGVVTYG